MIHYNPTRITCDQAGCRKKLVESTPDARSHPAGLVHQAEGIGWWIVAAGLDEPHWAGQRHYCPTHAWEHRFDERTTAPTTVASAEPSPKK